MLRTDHLLTLQQAQTALTKHGEAKLAADVGAIVTEQLRHRASVGASAIDRAAARAEGGQAPAGRAPMIAYAIELQPGWKATAHGSTEAHKMLEQALTECKAAHLLPKATSLSVTLSRTGAWWRDVETDNGTVSISVTRIGMNPA